MTDRYCALTVVLNHDIREDDAQSIIDAISMVKGVSKVVPQVSDPTLIVATTRVKQELSGKILNVLKDE